MVGFRSQYPNGSPGLWQIDYKEIGDYLGLWAVIVTLSLVSNIDIENTIPCLLLRNLYVILDPKILASCIFSLLTTFLSSYLIILLAKLNEVASCPWKVRS
jgi:hypothetical protein